MKKAVKWNVRNAVGASAYKEPTNMVNESIKTYHASAPISRSKLMKIAESPAKFKYLLEHPETPTDALKFGQAFHKMVLEPQDFNKEIAVEPYVNKRTNEGKQILADFYFENSEKTVIDAETYETAKNMAASVKADAKANFLLTGLIEKSYYWTDEVTGEAVKCRPDVTRTVGEKNVVVDLKSCLHADTESFIKEAVKYGYDVQAYMCKTALEKETGKEHDVIYVAVEKEPPYLINILQADEHFLEYGKRRYREMLGIYHECKQSGNWYGYLGFANAINELGLPAYILREFQEQV